MPKRKNFNRRALSSTSTRTHLEGRRSVKLIDLPLNPVRASRVLGFQGSYGGYQLVLTLYRIYIYCFQMCNRSPELMKSGDAGIFPAYYSLKDIASSAYQQEMFKFKTLKEDPYLTNASQKRNSKFQATDPSHLAGYLLFWTRRERTKEVRARQKNNLYF